MASATLWRRLFFLSLAMNCLYMLWFLAFHRADVSLDYSTFPHRREQHTEQPADTALSAPSSPSSPSPPPLPEHNNLSPVAVTAAPATVRPRVDARSLIAVHPVAADTENTEFDSLQRRDAVARAVLPRMERALNALSSLEYQVHDCRVLLRHCYMHQHSPLSPLLEPLVIVSAASSEFFGRMMNLIGSVHFWEPTTRIVIYDLSGDLRAAQDTFGRFCNVDVRAFHFADYPSHLRELNTYAWKPLIIQKTSEEFGSILWLDSSMELRGPLTEIKEHIYWDGYFTTTSYPNLWLQTHPAMFEWMHANANSPPMRQDGEKQNSLDQSAKRESEIHPRWREPDTMMISGNIIGFRWNSTVHATVVPLVARCALDHDCIAPFGHSKANHRYDQAAYSIALALANVPAFADHRFNAWDLGDPYVNVPADQQDQILHLFTRRGGGGPYESRARVCKR